MYIRTYVHTYVRPCFHGNVFIRHTSGCMGSLHTPHLRRPVDCTGSLHTPHILLLHGVVSCCREGKTMTARRSSRHTGTGPPFAVYRFACLGAGPRLGCLVLPCSMDSYVSWLTWACLHTKFFFHGLVLHTLDGLASIPTSDIAV